MRKIKKLFCRTENVSSILSCQYELLQKAYGDNAMLFHDMDHHLQTIYRMAQEAGNSAIMEYISHVGAPVRELSGILWTGVGIVDGILNEKKRLAEEKGYVMDIDAELPANTGIAAEDFCTILSNLLDNAIESMDRQRNAPVEGEHGQADGEKKEPEPIRVRLRRINHFLMIRVSNACREQTGRRTVLFQSAKKDRARHGWGLRSVRRAAARYGGSLLCEKDRGSFTATVLLFFPLSTAEQQQQ